MTYDLRIDVWRGDDAPPHAPWKYRTQEWWCLQPGRRDSHGQRAVSGDDLEADEVLSHLWEETKSFHWNRVLLNGVPMDSPSHLKETLSNLLEAAND